MKCDIVIPVWNQPECTTRCVDNIIKNTCTPCRLIIVDNGSDSQTRLYLEGLKGGSSMELEVIRNRTNLGFVKAANQGIVVSRAPYVCILNNDTVPGPGWLENLIGFAESHPEAGILNPLCVGHEPLSIEEYSNSIAGRKGEYMEMNQCFFFCALIKREVIDKVGLLDEAFGIGGFDDTDYSIRAALAGYRCVSVHSSYVYHAHGTSFKALGDKSKLTAQAQEYFYRKWPRHLRIGIGITLDGAAGEEMERFLSSVLFMARQWCWINLWIFGDPASAKEAIDETAAKIGMPSHQNIKYNYLGNAFKPATMAFRLIERSFGTKRRKLYDAVFSDDANSYRLLKFLSAVHNVPILKIAKPDSLYNVAKGFLDRKRHNINLA